MPRQRSNKKEGIWKCLSCLCCIQCNNYDDVSSTVATPQVDSTLVPTTDNSNQVDETLIPIKDSSTQVDENLIPTKNNSTQVDTDLVPTRYCSTQVDNALIPTRDNFTQVDGTLISFMDTATQMEETCCTAMCKTILELSERIEDLIAERDQQVQLECEQKLQEQQEEFDKELAFLARENQVLAAEKEKLQLEHKKSVSEMKEKHAQEKGKLAEVIRMERLKVVFERSHALEKMKESYRQQLLAVEESRRQEVQDVTSRYEEHLQETLHQLAECVNIRKKQSLQYDNRTEQLKEMLQAVSRENVDIKMYYEIRLTEETDTYLFLEEENNVLRNEVHKLEETAKTLSSQVDTLQQLTGEIQSLQEENVRLRREALPAECTGLVRQNAPRNRFRNRSIARHRTRIKHRATSQDQTAPTGQEYLSLQHLQT